MQLLRPSVPRLIIDIAAPSVAHYGPAEVLRLPVGRPPDDETDEPRGGSCSFRSRFGGLVIVAVFLTAGRGWTG